MSARSSSSPRLLVRPRLVPAVPALLGVVAGVAAALFSLAAPVGSSGLSGAAAEPGTAGRTGTTVRVLTANVWVNNPARAADRWRMRQLGADLVGVQEGRSFPQPQNQRRVVPPAGRQAEPPRDVPVFVGPDVRLRGHWGRQATRDLGGRYGKERWITVARTRVHGVRVALVNTHFNAVVQRPDGTPRLGLARTREYVRHMRQLLRVVSNQRREGFAPVVTCDCNWVPRSRSGWLWAPHVALRRVGLTYAHHGVDGIGYDPRAWTVAHRKAVRTAGSDHDWLLLDLRRR